MNVMNTHLNEKDPQPMQVRDATIEDNLKELIDIPIPSRCIYLLVGNHLGFS